MMGKRPFSVVGGLFAVALGAAAGSERAQGEGTSVPSADWSGQPVVHAFAETAMRDYAIELVKALNERKRYPEDGAAHDGTALVRFELDRSGRVRSASIVRTSGDSAIDDIALKMVEPGSMFPAPPPTVADDDLSFSAPLVFKPRRTPPSEPTDQ